MNGLVVLTTDFSGLIGELLKLQLSNAGLGEKSVIPGRLSWYVGLRKSPRDNGIIDFEFILTDVLRQLGSCASANFRVCHNLEAHRCNWVERIYCRAHTTVQRCDADQTQGHGAG